MHTKGAMGMYFRIEPRLCLGRYGFDGRNLRPSASYLFIPAATSHDIHRQDSESVLDAGLIDAEPELCAEPAVGIEECGQDLNQKLRISCLWWWMLLTCVDSSSFSW